MSLEKTLKQASATDPESLETLARELSRRGYGNLNREVSSIEERILNHKDTDLSLLDQWLTWFNTEMTPLEDSMEFENMPGGDGSYFTKVAFILLLNKKYEVVALGGSQYEVGDLLTNEKAVYGCKISWVT